jgi:hypothetical protein
MKWIALALALIGCQRGDGDRSQPTAARPAAQVTDSYRADISSLCNVAKLSGAEQAPEGDRMALTAMWLAQHITSSEGHQYLVTIQPLEGEAKAKALENEARRVGLDGCALAAEWRKPR